MASTVRILFVTARMMLFAFLALVFAALVAWAVFSFTKIEELQRRTLTYQEQEERLLTPGAAVAGCAERGGVVTHGPFGETYCRIDFHDAGRACTDTSQCVGGCIVFDEQAARIAGAAVKGECKAANVQYGCFSYVERGRAVLSRCID